MLYDAVIYDNEGIDMPGADRQIVRNRLRSLIVVGCTGSPAYVALFQGIRTFVMVPDIDIIRAAQAAITRPFARVGMAVRVARRQDRVLGMAYALQVWTCQAEAGITLSLACVECSLPTGCYCDVCRGALCTICDQEGRGSCTACRTFP